MAKSAEFDVDFADFTGCADFNADYADFDVDFANFNADFVDFDVDFMDFTDFSLKLVKLTIRFHSTVRIQGRNIKYFWKICKIWILPKSVVFFINSEDFLISA